MLSATIIIMNNIAQSSTSTSSTLTSHHHQPKRLVFSALLVCLLVASYEPAAAMAAASPAFEASALPAFTSTGRGPTTSHQSGPSLCPLVSANCHCKWTNGKQGAFCERRGLTTIPAQLPQDTQVLEFSGNALSQLTKDLFREKHLTNLQRLHLAECKISFIADEAFAQLTNLVELDLANNNLLAVPSKSFEPLTNSLRKLVLSHNPIQTIEPSTFSSLKHLTTLDLSNCQIGVLKPQAFHGLFALNDLKLAENRLTQLPMNVMNDLRDYTALDLYGNPWHCDCELRQSIEWMTRHHVQQAMAPTCASPQRHKDIRWQNVKPEELICPPVVINKQNELVVGAGSNVSLACSARGSSPLTFVWFQDEKNLTTGRSNVTEPPSSTKLLEEKRYEIAEEIGLNGQPNVTTSILYLFNLKITDTSLFLCWVENTAGYMLANFSLIVNDSPPAHLSWGENTYPGSVTPFWQSFGGLSPGETQLGIVSIGFVIVLAAAIILLLVIKHSTSRSTKSSLASDDLKSAKKGNHNNQPIGTISGSSKYNNGGHSRSMLADSEDIDDDDEDDDDDEGEDIDDDGSSSGSSCISKTNPKVVASGVSDGFIKHMQHGIISMEYHSLSPAYEFNNTLKKNNNNNKTNNQQQQQSLPYLDTSHHQAMHHFPGNSNASSAQYYGNGSPMATTTSDLSPGSGSVNTSFAANNPQQHHQQQQLNITNCDPQPHHLNDNMAPNNTANSYTTNDYQGGGAGGVYNDDPSHNMMPAMYQFETSVDPSTLHHYHHHHHQLQQQQHLHNMNHPPNGGHMYPAQLVAPTNMITATTLIGGHPQQVQQGDHLVVQSMMQQQQQQQQGRLMAPNQRHDDQFHHIL